MIDILIVILIIMNYSVYTWSLFFSKSYLFTKIYFKVLTMEELWKTKRCKKSTI